MMRRFSPEYLSDTRDGLWSDRDALAPLELEDRRRILDVGAGTGELTRVLESETDAEIVSVDVDRLLLEAIEDDRRILGDATDLPFEANSFDLVVCQALLVNLSEPEAAAAEFGRVSSDSIAAIEPDNSGVDITSTIPAESRLSDRARRYYMNGLENDASLGSRVDQVFRSVGFSDISVTQHPYVRRVEPPYSPKAVRSAKRKITGSRLAEQRSTMIRGGLLPTEFETLLEEWRSMGHDIAAEMQTGTYRRTATIPFYVTVGSVR